MGILTKSLDVITPWIKKAVKKNRNGGKMKGSNSFNHKTVGIPQQLVGLDMSLNGVDEMKMVKAIFTILNKEGLAGDESIFSLLSQGKNIGGKIIRTFVITQSMQPKDPQAFMLQVLMDLDEPVDRDSYLNRLSTALGDNPDDVKDKIKTSVGDVMFNMDDDDFENLLTNLI